MLFSNGIASDIEANWNILVKLIEYFIKVKYIIGCILNYCFVHTKIDSLQTQPLHSMEIAQKREKTREKIIKYTQADAKFNLHV